MKLSAITASLAAIAAAAPNELAKRQTENELRSGGRARIGFVYARGSTETGNMGTLGGPVCRGLEREFGARNVACQGVGGRYNAQIGDNMLPAGTSAGAIREATEMFELANQKTDIIVFGGYSQGAAVMHNAVKDLPAAIKSKTVGGVLFGDTRNAEDGGQVPNYPRDDVLIICRADDGVCGAGLVVTAGHLAYGSDGSVGKAVDFLVRKIKAA